MAVYTSQNAGLSYGGAEMVNFISVEIPDGETPVNDYPVLGAGRQLRSYGQKPLGQGNLKFYLDDSATVHRTVQSDSVSKTSKAWVLTLKSGHTISWSATPLNFSVGGVASGSLPEIDVPFAADTEYTYGLGS